MALIASSPEDLIACLDSAEQMLATKYLAKGEMISSPYQDIWFGNSVSSNRIGFLFPGQGSQQLNMGRRLVERYSWALDFKDKAETWLSESGYEKINEYIYRPLDRALNERPSRCMERATVPFGNSTACHMHDIAFMDAAS